MELTFIASELNITEDFMDIFFYASYEVVKVSDCKYKTKLTALGGEESAYFNMQNDNCNGIAWLLEAKRIDHSLFVQSWGSIIPANPTLDELSKCQTKNRLVVYSGSTKKNVKILFICPAMKTDSRQSIKFFSEDWMNSTVIPTK